MKKWIFQVVVAIVALMPLPSAMVSAQNGAGLSISDSAAPTLAAVGENVTFTYAIANTDNVTISGITLQDSLLGPIDLGGQTSLGAGENITATATRTVVQADLPGPLVSTATVTGTDANGNVVTASATATVELSYTASLQLAKVASPTSAGVGDNITYTYSITNNGPVAVTDIALTDVPLGAINLGQTGLNPGGTITATAIYTIAGSDLPGPLTNTATVSGKDPNGNAVTASATATVQLRYTASLQLAKSASPTSATVGDNITYSYSITNSGPVATDNITLEDDRLGTISLGQTSLNPGSSITATAVYTIAESDLPGPLVNTATVSGTDPGGNALTASATATVELTGTASLQMTKSADRSSATPHQTINYSFTVTNNGNVTINNLLLNDDKLGSIPLSSNTLAPGQSATANASHIVTTADLPGPIVNTATVSGTSATGQSVSASSSQVSVSIYVNFWELFKAEILKLRGVPGKGIEHAPGLQKPFNPKSHAAEHAGPKSSDNQSETQEHEQLQTNGDDDEGAEEQLEIRGQEENQGTEEQLQITEEVQNQASHGQATQSGGEANPGKGQLKHNGSSDNQTGGQSATGNGHKPDKDKTNKSKSGK